MTPRRPLVFFAVLAAVLPAAVARSGDPVPDVDVVLEQIPGGTVKVESRTGGFDEVAIEVGKPFAEALSAVRLPAGWTLEAKGKSVRLAGPAVPSGQPVRLVLDAGTAPRPPRISYQVRLDGRTLLRRKNERVHPVPPHKVIGSLQGIVTVPSQVAPGEPMRMRVTDAAALPSGGTWRLTGTVVAEEESGEEDGAPDEPVVVTLTSHGEARFSNPRFQEEFPVAFERIARFATSFASSIPQGASVGLTIAPDGSLAWDPADAAPPVESAEALLIDASDRIGGEPGSEDDIPMAIPVCRWWHKPVPCRNKKPKPRCPNGLPRWKCTHYVTAFAAADGAVDFELPEDLAPGGAIALQYVDRYGDVLVDAVATGVEVMEPVADGGVARILDATPLASAGQQACVCGVFPGPEAWNRLLLDGEALGPPVSASSRMAWVTLPADAVVGPHVVAGAPEAAFPADDRATIVVVTIGGEVDSQKLQRLETTPLRLWVEGTSEPVELRLRNETPSIISIDGGDDQRILTTGGEPNQLERTVRGLSPGAFDIQYELTGAACPCATEDAHYW